MDITSFPKGFAEWLICLSCAVWLASLVIDLVRKLKGEPAHPPNEQLAAAGQRTDDEITELKREDKVLHTRITELRGTVERIQGRLEK